MSLVSLLNEERGQGEVSGAGRERRSEAGTERERKGTKDRGKKACRDRKMAGAKKETTVLR